MGTHRVSPSRPWQLVSVRGFSLLLSSLLFLSHVSPATIRHGTVSQAGTGTPIAGVVIRIIPGGRAALSGQHGDFVISIPDSIPSMVEFRRVGYAPRDIPIAPSDSAEVPLRVLLEESPYSVDPVVTTATREAVAVDDVPFSIDVVSASELRVRNANDLGEALESVPGVSLQSYGGLGDIQTLSIRGSTANQVLILLDGQRMNTAQSGEIDLSTLPLESVRSIEVVRGGASAQYGADAMGGVVNIITGGITPSSGSGLTAGTGVGSFGTRSAHIGGSFDAGGVASSIGYRYVRSDNNFSFIGQTGTEVQRQNADITAHALTGRFEYRLSEDGGRVLFNGEYLHQESGDPGSLTFPLSRARKLTRNIIGNLTFEQPFGSHLASLHTYLQVLRFGYTDPDSYIPTATDNTNRAAGFELNDNLVLSKIITFTGGYSFRSDSYTGNSLSGEPSRVTHGLFVQSDIRPLGVEEASLYDLSIYPAVRWDHSSDFGGSVSPKLGITASMGSPVRFTVKANAGRSFRAPTFNDLYWPFDGFTTGNPSLTPERSTDLDAGVVIAVRSDAEIHAGLTYYANNVRDLILWQANQSGLWMPSNIGRAVIHGIESEISCSPIPGVARLTWALTTVSAVNKTDDPAVNGKVLPYQPSSTNKFSARIHQGPITCIVDLLALSRRYTNTTNTTSLPPAHTIDVSLGYTFSVGGGSFDLMGSLRNMENVRYQLVQDYPLPGRELRLTLDYTAGM